MKKLEKIGVYTIHTVHGWEVAVDAHGYVHHVYGASGLLYPYRYYKKYGCSIKESGLTLSAFRTAWARDSIFLH